MKYYRVPALFRKIFKKCGMIKNDWNQSIVYTIDPNPCTYDTAINRNHYLLKDYHTKFVVILREPVLYPSVRVCVCMCVCVCVCVCVFVLLLV